MAKIQVDKVKYNKLLKDTKTLTESNEELKKENGKLSTLNTGLTGDYMQLHKDLKTKDERIKHWTKLSAKATKALQERDAELEAALKEVEDLKEREGASKRKTKKHLQADDVNVEIDKYVKEILFRNVKFAQPGKELNRATKMVWAAIKDKQGLDAGDDGMTEDEFLDIYSSSVASALSGRRQYCQTRALSAVKGMYIAHSNL
jgi:hypothetical protein